MLKRILRKRRYICSLTPLLPHFLFFQDPAAQYAYPTIVYTAEEVLSSAVLPVQMHGRDLLHRVHLAGGHCSNAVNVLGLPH